MGGTILVTGGAGYVGSHACKALARAGYRPVTFDSLERGHEEAVRWGPLVRGDILDRAAVAAALAEHRPVTVMHFAAYAYVGESVDDPALYYRNNVLGTLTLLEAMLEAGVTSFVFSSTCATYGVPEALPIPEDHPQRPINPYGRTKLVVEGLLRDMQPKGLRWVALRYFNAAGADPDGELAEAHDPETHLIPLVIDAALGRIPHIRVNGDDYPTPDGTCIRDYIHVSDLADAHVLAMRHLLAGGDPVALNLGNGRGASIREVIRMVEAVSGRVVPVQMGERRPGDPPALVGDPSSAQRLLGWRPARGDLETIIRDAWNSRAPRNG